MFKLGVCVCVCETVRFPMLLCNVDTLHASLAACMLEQYSLPLSDTVCKRKYIGDPFCVIVQMQLNLSVCNGYRRCL